MHEFHKKLRFELNKQADSTKKSQMEAYMKHHFSFFGVPAPLRKTVFKSILHEIGKPPSADWRDLVWALWRDEERELQYIAQELMWRFKKDFQSSDIDLLEDMITYKSWWDTVDFLAANQVAHFFISFPQIKFSRIEKWIKSENIWLNRTAILFQLKYKLETDEELLYDLIRQKMHEKEFFIAKAIGWALRAYSKVNPSSVRHFIDNHPLQTLSKKEGGKYC